MMTNRERIAAALEGRNPDRVPWIARIQLWYNARLTEGNMPERFQGLSMREVARELGTGDPARNGKAFNVRYEGLELRTEQAGGVVRTHVTTPYGAVVYGTTASDYLQGRVDSGLPLEHPIKSVDDYRVWEYVAEHTYYDPCYEEFEAYDEQVGDDGLPMLSAGDCPFHHFQLRLSGYNDAFFEMVDHPQEFEHLMTVMTQVDRERLWPVVADSPAKLVLHGVHFDSQMTPPKLFRRYITPYYQEFSALLHSRGKKLAFHADDDSKAILADCKEAGFDYADCFCSAPMVSVTVAEARAAWGGDVVIYGGVPSVVLEPEYGEEQFEAYMKDLFRAIAPGDAFVLGVSDNVMPRSMIERVERITEMVEEYGRYPIQPNRIA